MGEPTEGDVAFACVSLLIDELVRNGASGASISPGSRSTPIALALSRHGGIPVHVHLDERSSAFFALGLAKATGRPAIVSCTSGTAVANLLPAVVEAAQSDTPLILLTGDRPPELRGTGANQTIDQVEIFGPYARLFVDAEVPKARPDAAQNWRALGRRSVAAATGPPAGPVHVNLPFREPLVPTGRAVDLGPNGRDQPPPSPDALPVDVSALVELLSSTECGVILAGTLAGVAPTVRGLADAAGWPLIAEPTSGLRTPAGALAAGQHLLTDEAFASATVPDVVLQFGAPPTTRAAQGLAARARQLIVVGPKPYAADPGRRASLSIPGEPEAVAHAALERLTPQGQTDWLERWRDADTRASAAVAAVLDADDEPFEGRVARDLAAWLPDQAVLVVGSSMPVRDLDAYMLPRVGVRVIANRGASGIDGLVSTALGVSAAGAPTYALIGDLSLMHDIGALLWSATRGYDAVFVVPNNQGGGVFDLLPPSELPEHESLFVTPHHIDLEAIASAAGAGYWRVERSGELLPMMEKAAASAGVRLVEVVIDRPNAIAVRRRCREAVAAALRAGS
jgi:2-succinyl-5-enolpyruvyl-6-hydroxy-3-cyclohexene-1-carboxylate synthase